MTPVASALASVHNTILAVVSNRQYPKLAAAFGSGSHYFRGPSIMHGQTLKILILQYIDVCDRRRKEYQFLAGMWCAKRKSPTLSFFEPTITELQFLETHGI